MNQTMRRSAHARWAGLLAVCLCGAGWVSASRPAAPPPDPKPPVLARAGDVTVTAEAFRTDYVDYLLRTGLQDRPSLRKAFLDNLVASRLLVREARAGGIEREAAYRVRQEQLRRKLLVEAYAQRVLYDTLDVREEEVRAMFARAHTRLTVRHLYARTREQAEALYARLRAGEAFEALAREVFADPRLAENGGFLGDVGFDEMDPAFEDAAYALAAGETSTPVRTARGYSIIRLEDRFTEPLLTEFDYAKKRPNLRAYVLRRKRLQARSAHAHRLADDLDAAFEAAALDRLLGQITGAGVVDGDEGLRRLLADTLVAFGPPSRRRSWTVDDVRERARFTSEEHRAQVRTRRDLIDFIQGLVVHEVMMERAQEQGLGATPAFEQALREAMDAYVLARTRERLAAGVAVPEDSVRRYFETAPPGEFMHPAQGRGGEIAADTPAGAGRPMTYEEARPRIVERLRYRYTEARERAAYADVRARYDVDVDTELLYSLPLIHENAE